MTVWTVMAHCSQQHFARRQLGSPEIRSNISSSVKDLRKDLRMAPPGCQDLFEGGGV